MKKAESKSTISWDEEDLVFQLRLFVTGASPLSARAIQNLQTLLEQKLKGRYKLEIVDVHQQPALVQSEDVTAVPMLIKKTPLPKRRLVGDMSDTQRVLKGLGLSY